MKPPKGKSRHHITPRSRGGNGNKANIAILKKKEHNIYHELFDNMTPDEIIMYLVNHFWNGQSYWLKKAMDGIRKQRRMR